MSTIFINIFFLIFFSTFLLFQIINSNQDQCIGEGLECENDNDCCGGVEIRCAWNSKNKYFACKKTCNMTGYSDPDPLKNKCCYTELDNNKCVTPPWLNPGK
ncbi:hypothetical protein ACQ4LE_010216 [Meloidogyne hapla]